jgi:hypothetical protein
MSFSIPTSYVEQFGANVHMLSEQRFSRLRSTVNVEDVTGESFAKERLGGVDAPNTVTTLHGDTPLNGNPHTRRWGFMSDHDVADLIDKQSKVKLLIDPQSLYTIRHAGTMGRGLDDAIISALGGAAAEGKAGTSSSALPAGQKVLVGGTGLTVAKLRAAKKLLDEAEVDEMFERFIVVQSAQIDDLLGDTNVTSSDFNTVKALVQGEIDQYMGFRFIRSQRLQVDGASSRLVYAYAQPAVTLGVGQEPQSIAAPRPDKRHSMQVYTYGSWGAVRVEDEMVVEIACAE